MTFASKIAHMFEAQFILWGFSFVGNEVPYVCMSCKAPTVQEHKAVDNEERRKVLGIWILTCISVLTKFRKQHKFLIESPYWTGLRAYKNVLEACWHLEWGFIIYYLTDLFTNWKIFRKCGQHCDWKKLDYKQVVDKQSPFRPESRPAWVGVELAGTALGSFGCDNAKTTRA